MRDLRRASTFAGPAAALILLVGGIFGNVGGAPSPYRASSAQIVTHYARNGQNTDIAAVANLFAAVLLVVFAAGLWLRFCDAESEAARGWALVGLTGAGGLAVISMVLAAAQISLAGLAGIETPPGDVVRGAAVAVASSMQVASLAAVPLLGGFGLAALNAQIYARWLAWLAVAAAISGVIGVLPDVAAGASVALADLLGLLGQLEMPLFVMWLLGVSFSAGRTMRPVGSPAEDPGADLEEG